MTDVAAQLDELREWARRYGLELTDRQLQAFANYLKTLKLWSRRLSLIGSAEEPFLVRKHLADCVFVAIHCPDVGRAADLGSGAGMPGIPVAITRPRLEVDLVESRAKKASFLTAASHDIANVHVLNRRIEDLAGADYDLATARALAPLDRLLPLARSLLRDGGLLLAMKSGNVDDEISGIDLETTGFALCKTSSYQLPTGEQRTLLEFEATPCS